MLAAATLPQGTDAHGFIPSIEAFWGPGKVIGNAARQEEALGAISTRCSIPFAVDPRHVSQRLPARIRPLHITLLKYPFNINSLAKKTVF